MSTVPPYSPPSVGPSGLAVPSYQSILADNLQAFLNIYGLNQYVGQDSAIYQLLSIISLKQSDTMQAAQLAYNQSSPQTAVGAGLDRQVKMNGLARDPFTYSTVLLQLSGVAETSITNGFVQDQNSNLWALPSPLVLGTGTTTTIATCTTPGNITAEPGTVNIINTPVSGWNSVTNVAPATPGNAVEADSALRARQSISVALPSITPLAGTVAALFAVPGVTRVAPGYPTPGGPGSSIENPTGAVDSWGNPAHSISMAVENGDASAIALAIYIKKTIGCFTNGGTPVVVTDPVTGFQETISFWRPSYTGVLVLATIHGYASTPTTATIAAVQLALVSYLNELQIGETVSVAALIYEAMAVNASLTQPGFGVQSLRLAGVLANTTTNTTLGSNILILASITGVVSGALVVGAGIPVGTTVFNIIGPLSIALTANATASASGVAVAFSSPLNTLDVPMPTYHHVAQSQASWVNVVAV